MTSNQSNKLRAYQTVHAVLDEHQAVWDPLPAFGAAVQEFTALIPEINDLAQTQASRLGAAEEKANALDLLGDAAFETAAAVRAFASATEKLDLIGRVDFSRSELTNGREGDVVARCRDIHAAATTWVDDLEDYGITPAKLTKLKNKTDLFASLQPKPRHKIATGSAATVSLPQRFREADDILRKRMDGLVVQFKEMAPDFYYAYRAARVIVDNASGRKANGTPTPAPVPT